MLAFQACDEFDYTCRFTLVAAQRAAGDKKGAAATLAKLKASPHIDNSYAFFWLSTK